PFGSTSPQPCHAKCIKDPIVRDDRQILQLRLGGEHAIERVKMRSGDHAASVGSLAPHLGHRFRFCATIELAGIPPKNPLQRTRSDMLGRGIAIPLMLAWLAPVVAA